MSRFRVISISRSTYWSVFLRPARNLPASCTLTSGRRCSDYLALLNMANDRFSVVDYVVFSIMLLISALIGIWYGCGPGGKQKTTAEYLLANRKMRQFPVAISLLVSYLSAITLLGVPSEIYTYGAQYYVLIVSYFIICGTVAVVFVPMFRRVNITCANEVSLSSFILHQFDIDSQFSDQFVYLWNSSLYTSTVKK